MVFKKGQKAHNKKDIDLKLMQKLYFEDKWDYKKIANFFGFKSKSAIYDRFKLLNLKARDNIDLKTGFKHSKETKRKISEGNKGREVSKENRKKMSKRVSGRNNPMYGKRSWNYKDEYISNGYKIIHIDGKIWIEHRYIWLRDNNTGLKFIPKGWDIHHKNGIKTDNEIENLQLLPHDIHVKIHKLEEEKLPRDSKGRFLSIS